MKTRSEKEAKAILTRRFQEKIQSFEEKKVEIIENNVTIEKVDDAMVAKGDLVIIEPITMWKGSAGHLEHTSTQE